MSGSSMRSAAFFSIFSTMVRRGVTDRARRSSRVGLDLGAGLASEQIGEHRFRPIESVERVIPVQVEVHGRCTTILLMKPIDHQASRL
jgi:hypothetical protein